MPTEWATISQKVVTQQSKQSILRAQPHPQLLMWYKHLVDCSVRIMIL